jgi:lysophospholipase L1-like esterase
MALPLAAGVASSCSHPPASPSNIPAPGRHGESAIACALPVQVLSRDGGPVEVHFRNPVVAANGVEIEKVECRPGSGSLFPIGLTQVSCEVRDETTVVAQCAFGIRVIFRRLAHERFLAFGDSITNGFVPPELTTESFGLGPLDAGSSRSYPYKLNVLLRERFPTQPIEIENAGRGGEHTTGGEERLPDRIDDTDPDVLLLLEGINDIPFRSAGDILANLEQMVRIAQNRGVLVIIATLTPLGPDRERNSPGAQARVADVNRGIFDIARRYNLGRVVDLFTLFSTNPELMASDQKHPNLEGQTAIAQAFFTEIISRWETVQGAN